MPTPQEMLLDAIRRGEPCDLSNGQKDIRHTEMAGWGDDRAVPADVLRQILRGEHSGTPEARLVLVGAAITGTLDLSGQSIPPIRLQCCRLDDVCFENATFTGDASFDGASFTGDAWFDAATFNEGARFKNSAFTKLASFPSARFAKIANFEGATFAAGAWFKEATFTHAAPSSEREDKNVYVVASFDEARFAGDAWFERATFLGAAHFQRAEFAARAWFKEATFTATAAFGEATFTGGTVKFGGEMWLRQHGVRAAEFTGALARTWYLKAAKFHTLDPGPWIGETVNLDSAVLLARSRVQIAATKQLDAHELHAQDGAHLVVDSPQVDLANAEFLRPSILAGAATATEMPQRKKPESFLSAIVAAVSSTAATRVTPEPDEKIHVR